MTTAAPAVALAPRVRVDGTELPARLAHALTSVRVVRALRTTAWARLVLDVDDGADVVDVRDGVRALRVGQRLELAGRAGDRASVATFFTGDVTRVEVARGGRGGTRLVVTAQDATARLASETARAFVDQDLQAMLTKVLGGTSLRLAASGLPPERVPYLLQAGSGLRFVDDVARRAGLDWVLVDDSFHVWPAGTARPGTRPVEVRAEETLATEVSQQSGGPTRAEVRAWDVQADEVVTASDEADVPRGLDVAERVVLDSSSSPLTVAEATRVARARLAGAGAVAARAEVGRLLPVAPGETLRVADAWWPDDAGYVREVTVTWGRAGFATEVVTGTRAPASLADLPGQGDGRGAAAYRHDGVVVGVVSELGRSSDERSAGRVRVAFQFLGATVTSDWARLAAAGAGDGRGLSLVPEVGDEVLVAFEGSDVRRPVVVAGLHSARRKAPGVDPVKDDRVERRSLTSRTGHVVELADGTDEANQHVLLALAGAEHRLRLGKDAAELTMPSGKPVTITSGSTRIHLADDGKVTVEGTDVVLRARGKLSLEGAEVSLKGTSRVTVEGADVSVKGQAKVAVEASGVTQVKGGMVQIN